MDIIFTLLRDLLRITQTSGIFAKGDKFTSLYLAIGLHLLHIGPTGNTGNTGHTKYQHKF